MILATVVLIFQNMYAKFIGTALKFGAYVKYAILLIEYYLTIKSMKPLTPNEEKALDLLVEFYDKKTDTGAVDKIDHLVLKPVFKNLYKVMKAKSKNQVQVLMEDICNAIATQDSKKLEIQLATIANAKIDIPGIDEDQEQEIFLSQINVLALIGKSYLNKL